MKTTRGIGSLTCALLAIAVSLAPAIVNAQPAEFVFVQPAEAGSLDHFLDFTVAGLGIHAHIYDPLVDMEGPGMTLVPKLAVSWQTPNATTWRFSLRRGVTFHNGQELTADDVKFTFDQANTGRSVKRPLVATIDKVTAVDRYTIELTTKQPDAALLSRLAFVYVVNKAAYEKDAASFGRVPVGTGRYRVARWEKDQQLVLEAFGQYWGPKPSVGRLVVKPIREATARVAELQTGRAHVIKGVPVEMARNVSTMQGMKLRAAKGVRQLYFLLNATKPPFNDVRVRRAVNYAVDRGPIVAHILEGFGEVRNGPFGPRQWGYDPGVKGYGYDPESARRLIKEAGYPNGIDVTWDIAQGVAVKGTEIAEAIANQLRQVGVRARLNILDPPTLTQKRNAGNFQMTMNVWSWQADPDAIVSGLRMHSTVNTWFKDDTIDGLIDESRRTLDPSARLGVYHQLYRALVESAPHLWTHAQDELFGVRADVEWDPYPFGGNAGMSYFIPIK